MSNPHRPTASAPRPMPHVLNTATSPRVSAARSPRSPRVSVSARSSAGSAPRVRVRASPKVRVASSTPTQVRVKPVPATGAAARPNAPAPQRPNTVPARPPASAAAPAPAAARAAVAVDAGSGRAATRSVVQPRLIGGHHTAAAGRTTTAHPPLSPSLSMTPVATSRSQQRGSYVPPPPTSTTTTTTTTTTTSHTPDRPPVHRGAPRPALAPAALPPPSAAGGPGRVAPQNRSFRSAQSFDGRSSADGGSVSDSLSQSHSVSSHRGVGPPHSGGGGATSTSSSSDLLFARAVARTAPAPSREKSRRRRKKKARRGGGKTKGEDSATTPLLSPVDREVESGLPRERVSFHSEKAPQPGGCECVCNCGRLGRCNCCSLRSLCTMAVVVLLVLGGLAAGWYFLMYRHHSHSVSHIPSRPWFTEAQVDSSVCLLPSANPFYFWRGLTDNATWWVPLAVNANQSFQTTLTRAAMNVSIDTPVNHSNITVHVDWADHYAIQLHGNPEYLRSFDDIIRAWNPNARYYSGTIDSCGWPLDPFGKPGFHKSVDCFWEDFRYGWNDTRIKIAFVKSCCTGKSTLQLPNFTYYPRRNSLPYEGFVAMGEDTVEYPPGVFRKKNVMTLIALNKDASACGLCPAGKTCPGCHKEVVSAGAVQTAKIYASGRYDVIAKVPKAAGLIWAVWTYHSEDHIDWPSCSDFSCYKDGYRGLNPDLPPSKKVPWRDCCGNVPGCCQKGPSRNPLCPPMSECKCCDLLNVEGACKTSTVCDKYWPGLPAGCALEHNTTDPQSTGNTSIGSWKTLVNHEIDIEIPANCEGTTVCGETALPSMNFTERERQRAGCINRYHTANFNNYILTNAGGTGPAYTNMCVAAFKEHVSEDGKTTEVPFPLMGDDRYHKYTIDWHTGGVDCNGTVHEGRVDFYVDDVYMGTNNVFVPTRASRLTISSWASTGHYSWNNWPDNWGGGYPNDGKWYMQHTHISEVKVTPYDEPNDIVYPMSYDQPDGCQRFYDYNASCHKFWADTSHRPGPLSDPEPGVLGMGCSPPAA